MSLAENARTPAPNVLILGTGVVGGAFLETIRRPLPTPLRLFGVANSRGVALADADRDEVRAEDIAQLLARTRSIGATSIDDDVLDRLARRSGSGEARGASVLVDATAADGMGPLYERALRRGIHVVTANKKPLAAAWSDRERLFAAAPPQYPTRLRYEATVGAGLPVIETLKNLVRTGDRVKRIDCVLSGTLGFLCNEIADGTPLSRAVALARERGFTEPDTREDLGGADVARKAVILSRELGAHTDTSDVDLQPFVPAELLAKASPKNLEAELKKLDEVFASRTQELRRRGEKLVYLARVEVGANDAVKASAGPVVVPAAHPAAQLEGSSALVAFTTARYASDALVVRGSGAGGAVTASALLADVFAATGHV